MITFNGLVFMLVPALAIHETEAFPLWEKEIMHLTC